MHAGCGLRKYPILRDHLHVWAFSHVDAIARTYASIFPEVSTRDVEIFAPIRVLAQLSGSEPLIREVDDALATTRSSSSTTPSEAMEDALLGILTRAIANHRRLPTVITVLEMQMRLRIQEGVHARKFSSAAQSDLDSPEWIGRQLKDIFAPLAAEPIRVELHGRATRFYPLGPEILAKALTRANAKREDLADDNNPRAFCASCSSCDYQEVCEIRSRKLQAEARLNNRGRRVPPSIENPVGADTGLH